MAALGSRDIRALKILAAFLVLAGLVALYMYVLLPQKEALDLAREEMGAAEAQLRSSLRKLDMAEEAEEAMSEALEQLRAEESMIADEGKLAYLLRDLEDMTKRAGIRLVSMRFSPAKTIGRFLDVGLIMELRGGYSGMKKFYDSLEALNRKIAVRSFGFNLQSETAGETEGVTQFVEVLQSTCSLSLFIRPEGGAQDGGSQ